MSTKARSLNSINCRQCGTAFPADDFPAGEFKCPYCGWRELVPRAYVPERKAAPAEEPEATAEDDAEPAEDPGEDAVAEEVAATDVADEAAGHTASDAVDANADADEAVDAAPEESPEARTPGPELNRLAPDAFVLWCRDLLGRFGYVPSTGADDDAECALVLERGEQTLLVDCVVTGDGETVDRAACQRLLGAMVAARARRGMLITTDAFDPACREFVERVPEDMRIELVDGDRLNATVTEMDTGPLRHWWM
jgi:DNA-directed RNA polymerase subunit RPC12/RpoP